MCSYRAAKVFGYEKLAQTLWGIKYVMKFEQHDLSKMWKIVYPSRKHLVVTVSDKGLWLSSCLFPQPEHIPQGAGTSFVLFNAVSPGLDQRWADSKLLVHVHGPRHEIDGSLWAWLWWGSVWQFNKDGFGLAVQSTSHVARAREIVTEWLNGWKKQWIVSFLIFDLFPSS